MMFSNERTIRFSAIIISVIAVSAFAELGPNLTGEAVTIGSVARSITYIDGRPQNDYRPDISHRCFSDARIRFHDDDMFAPGISSHSTAIASLLVGSDPGVSAFRGVAPQAELDVFEFWHFVTKYVFFQESPNVDVLTMSLGSAFDEWWTRGIEAMAQKFGLLVIAGIGNGTDAFDPPLYPGAGANVLGVGVVDSVGLPNGLLRFTLPDANHSSSGPTYDGRCKPDIVAGGNYLAAAAGGYELTGDYSSYAAPIVTGAAALLIQKAKSEPGFSDAVSSAGGNCVLKSILMTSATKLAGWHKGTTDTADDNEFPLDFNQGAGMLDAGAAMELLTSGQWDSNTLSPNIYPVVAEPNSGFLAATLVWNRVYSGKYPFEPLLEKDVDLRLELWAADINEPGEPVLVDYSDSPLDNVEHIYYQVDEKFTDYELIVTTADGSAPEEPGRYGVSWQSIPLDSGNKK